MVVKAKGETITYAQLKTRMTLIPYKELRETERFLKGDHWQGRAGWAGYEPSPTNVESFAKTWTFIEKCFTPKNVCLGMVKRIEGAVFGKQPDFAILVKNPPTDPDPEKEANREKTAEEKFYQDIDSKIVEWYDKNDVHEHLKKFIFTRAGYGKPAIRIYIPRGYLQNGELSGTFEKVLSKIKVDTPHFSTYTDDIDPEFGTRYTILEIKESQTADSIFEVCYINEKGQTVVRMVDNKQGAPMQEVAPGEPLALDELRKTDLPGNEVTADLGGNLLTFIKGEYDEAIISPTVKRQQKAVNKAKTGESIALDNASFPDTTFINADIPDTEEIKNKDGKTITRPLKMTFGAGMWRKIRGYITTDDQGAEAMTTPEIHQRDPVDPKRYAEVAENNTKDMHMEAGMLYIYIASSPYPSGDSRAEAMTDYLILLVAFKTLCDAVGRWLLETVVRLAFNFSNETARINQFKVIFSTNVTIGRISNEDKATMQKEVEMGARTLRNYMIKAEVTDDPDGEVNAYLIEKASGMHENLESAQKEKELDQQVVLAEKAIAARPAPAPNGAGAGAGA